MKIMNGKFAGKQGKIVKCLTGDTILRIGGVFGMGKESISMSKGIESMRVVREMNTKPSALVMFLLLVVFFPIAIAYWLMAKRHTAVVQITLPEGDKFSMYCEGKEWSAIQEYVTE